MTRSQFAKLLHGCSRQIIHAFKETVAERDALKAELTNARNAILREGLEVDRLRAQLNEAEKFIEQIKIYSVRVNTYGPEVPPNVADWIYFLGDASRAYLTKYKKQGE